MVTTKDCKDAIAQWINKTKDADLYFNGYDTNIKRIWKRMTNGGNTIRAFRPANDDDQLLYVVEENNNLVVTPNHPDIIWTFSF